MPKHLVYVARWLVSLITAPIIDCSADVIQIKSYLQNAFFFATVSAKIKNGSLEYLIITNLIIKSMF